MVLNGASEETGTRALGNTDWPMFRGDEQHTGLSPYSTASNPGRLNWSFDTDGRIRTSPVIDADGNLFFSSDDGYFYSIDPNANLRWRYKIGNFKGSGVNDLYDSTPLVDSDGNVYVGSDSSFLYSFTNSGTIRWSTPVDAMGELRSSPVMDENGIIYIGSQEQRGVGSMYAYYSSNGTCLWRYQTKSYAVISSPALDLDGNVVFGTTGNMLICLYPNGTLNWKTSLKGSIVSSPSIDSSGNIYVGSYSPQGGVGILWSLDSSGAHRWSYSNSASPIYSSPAIGPDGTIYIGSDDNALYAVDGTRGTLDWTLLTGGKVISSPAVDSDGVIYVGSEDMYLYSINPDGNLRWKYKTGGMIHSSPAIGSDGRVYVGSDDGDLYSLFKGAPDAPRNFLASGGDSHVNLTWQSPIEDGGSEVTGYNIYRAQDGGLPAVLLSGHSDLYYRDDTTENGITYDYYLTAVNVLGESNMTGPMTATPMRVPYPITDLSIRNGSGFVELSWELPLEDGGSPLTKLVIFRGGESFSLEELAQTTPDQTSYNDTDVVNGDTYYYRIFAENIMGRSVGSDIHSGLPIGVPTAPLDLVASAFDGFVLLSWDEPADVKGSPLIGYQVFSGPAEGSEILLNETIELQYNHSDAENGVEHHYYVLALNGVGASLPSGSVMVTPLGVPSSPTDLLVSQVGGEVHITWNGPEDDGGSPISSFRIFRSVNGGEFELMVSIPADQGLEYNDAGVSDPNSYGYRIYAVNPVGQSHNFVEALIQVRGVPDAPVNLTAVSGDGYVLLTWEGPEYDGLSPITSFAIWREDDAAPFSIGEVGPDIFEYNDTTTFNGETYQYFVLALNEIGESGRSDRVQGEPIKEIVPPSPPKALTASLSGDAIDITWEGVDDDGGNEVSSYNIYRRVNDNGSELIRVFTSSIFFYADTDVMPGNTYYYYLTAENSAGESAPSGEVSVVIEKGEDPPPTDNRPGEKGEEEDNTMIFLAAAMIIAVIIAALIAAFLVLRKKPSSPPPAEPVMEQPLALQTALYQEALAYNEAQQLPPAQHDVYGSGIEPVPVAEQMTAPVEQGAVPMEPEAPLPSPEVDMYQRDPEAGAPVEVAPSEGAPAEVGPVDPEAVMESPGNVEGTAAHEAAHVVQ